MRSIGFGKWRVRRWRIDTDDLDLLVENLKGVATVGELRKFLEAFPANTPVFLGQENRIRILEKGRYGTTDVSLLLALNEGDNYNGWFYANNHRQKPIGTVQGFVLA